MDVGDMFGVGEAGDTRGNGLDGLDRAIELMPASFRRSMSNSNNQRRKNENDVHTKATSLMEQLPAIQKITVALSK